MKTGIYLGPPLRGARGLGRLLVLFGVVGTLLHLGIYLRQVRELDAVRSDVERREGAVANAASLLAEGELSEGERAVLARLGALSESGAPTSILTTELLQLVAHALPNEVALVSVSFDPSTSPPSLLVEALARREEDVTAFERRMAASSRVAATRLLGERSDPDGTLSVRLQVDLTP
ncbi:MAG: hypothetical protein BMS9Abin37_3208 [Acidobacteriota bacterium]|nr:MAG: hypothetical protein BMS9Abin37_3208 [Acidobacteriota bacterium]